MKDARKPSVPKEPSTDGGLGDGSLSDRTNLRLVARALKEEWPIPAKLRGKVVATLESVLDDSESSPRDKATASRALISASKVNLASISIAIAADDHENVKARLDEIEDTLKKQSKGGRR